MKIKNLLLIGLIPILFFVFSCSFFPTMSDEDLNAAQSDAELIQAMIPGLEAAMAVYKMPEGTKTFAPSTVNGYPDKTPGEYYTDYYNTDNGYARYPETGYLEDFYGTQGNQAYLELRAITSGGGNYEVSLYISPTLSPSVKYTLEKYRIALDSWDLVDSTGAKDAIAFESINTYYFDGRVETRTVGWTRYANTDTDKIYPADDFPIPDDPADLTIPSSDNFSSYKDTTLLKTDAAGDGQYSSYTESSIPATADSGNISTTAKEYYSELSDLYKYSKSYVKDDLSATIAGTTTMTTRVYSEDTDGNKKVRSKSTGDFSYGGFSWTNTTTEKVDITVDASGAVSYNSTVMKTATGDITSTITTVISLTETAANSNSFTGTERITIGSTNYNYSVTLDPKSGLQITDNNGTDISYLVNSIQTNPLIQIVLSRKAQFTGKLVGGILKGKYIKNSKQADVILSRMFLKLTSGTKTKVK